VGIPPANEYRSPRETGLISSSNNFSHQRVNNAALGALSQQETPRPLTENNTDHRTTEIEKLSKQFHQIDNTFTSSNVNDFEWRSQELQSAILNYLSGKILETPKNSEDSSANSKALETAVISSIKLWNLHTETPPTDRLLLLCFDDQHVGEMTHALCSNSEKYNHLHPVSSILISVLDLRKGENVKSSLISRSSSSIANKSDETSKPIVKNDSLASAGSYDPNLDNFANAYRVSHKDLKLEEANNITQKGTAESAINELIKLYQDSSVVVLGEGSHDEFALDAILAIPSLPDLLFAHNVKIVLAEHIFPEHAKNLLQLDCSEIANHLQNNAFRNLGKVCNYLQFLKACSNRGIEIIAADKKDIYSPRGTNINIYNQLSRLELLNKNIEDLYALHKNKGKALIIIGAAHSNHRNASASRSGMGQNKPDYSTPGVTDVIDGAQEFIVVKKRPDAEKIPLSTIRKGMVFEVEV
jgi:hypothetical protein